MIVLGAARRGLILAVGLIWCCGCYPVSEKSSEEENNRYFQTGKSLVNSLDYPGAVEAFEKALQENPRSASAHFELGLIYYQNVSDYAAAIYHFEKYLRLRPDAAHAENVRQFISVCKQELAKTVSLGPVTQKVMRDLDELRKENLRLRQQVEALSQSLQIATNRPSDNTPVSASPPAVRTNGAPSLPGNHQPNPFRPAPLSGGSATNPPAGTPGTHVVKAGETPSQIARQYGLKLSALMAANPGLDPRRLRVGQRLKIPSVNPR